MTASYNSRTVSITGRILIAITWLLADIAYAAESAKVGSPVKLLIEARTIAVSIPDQAERSSIAERIVTAQIPLDPAGARETLKLFPRLPNNLNHLVSLASKYAQAGNLDETERMYAEILIEDRSSPQGKLAAANALGQLAMAQANAGKIDEAFHTLSRVRELAREKPLAIVGTATAGIAEAQARHGDIPGAVRTALSILGENPYPLMRIIGDRMRAGKMHEAESIISGLDDHAQRYGQWGIVQAQKDLGRLTEAQITTSAIKPGHAKASALLDLAQHHLEHGSKHTAVGLLQEAATSAMATVNHFTRADILWRIATAMAESGETFTALETAKSIEKDGHRKSAIQDIVKAQAKQGDFKGAFNNALLLKQDTSPDADDADRYQSTVSEILAELVKSGRAKEARETVGHFEDLKHQSRILYCRIAWAQADTGDIRGAKATLLLVEPESQREIRKKEMLRLAQIPKEHLDKNDFQRLEELRDLDMIMHWTLEALAKAQAKKGDLSGAVTTASGLTHSFYRSSLLKEIAVIQVTVGRTKEALAWARALPSPSDKADALIGIAQALAAQKTSSH